MISEHFAAVQAALAAIDVEQVAKVAELIKACHNRGGTTWLIGNGGSAATASHFSCDLQKVAQIRAMALTDNMPLVTAWANDSEYRDIFTEQFRQVRRAGDMVVLISCSGISPNILAMMRFCIGYHDMATLFGGGRVPLERESTRERQYMGVAIHSTDYGVIEDCHLSICHAITKELSSNG